MGNSVRTVALILFLALAGWFLVTARTQSPSEELAVLRSVLSDIEATLLAEVPDPLASTIFISNPTLCELEERPDFVPEPIYESYMDANAAGSSPIRLGSLNNLVAVVAFNDSHTWQENIHDIDVGERSLIGVSRVGMAKNQALVCLDAGYMGLFYLLERSGDQWETVEIEQAWIT